MIKYAINSLTSLPVMEAVNTLISLNFFTKDQLNSLASYFKELMANLQKNGEVPKMYDDILK